MSGGRVGGQSWVAVSGARKIGSVGAGGRSVGLRVTAAVVLAAGALTVVPSPAAGIGESGSWGARATDGNAVVGWSVPSRPGWTTVLDIAMVGGGGGGGGGHWSGGGGGASGHLEVVEQFVPEHAWKPDTWTCDLQSGGVAVGGGNLTKLNPFSFFPDAREQTQGSSGSTSEVTCSGQPIEEGGAESLTFVAPGGVGGGGGLGYEGGHGGTSLTNWQNGAGSKGEDANCPDDWHASGGAGGTTPTAPSWTRLGSEVGRGGAGGRGACFVAEGESRRGTMGASGAVVIDSSYEDWADPVTTVVMDDGWHNDDVTLTVAVTDLAHHQRRTSFELVDDDQVVETFTVVWGRSDFDAAMAARGSYDRVEKTVTLPADGRNGQYRLRYWSTDSWDNVEFPRSLPVWFDMAAPTIQATRTAPNAHGWNNTAVTVTFDCADPPASPATVSSGITDCTDPQVLDGEGAGQSATGTAVDHAGNTTVVTIPDIDIDLTPPVLTFGGNAGRYTIDDRVDISCSAADTLSGLASSTCPERHAEAWEIGRGSHTLQASSTDRADNQATLTTTFEVVVEPLGLQRLTSRLTDQLAATASRRQDQRLLDLASSRLRDALADVYWVDPTHLDYQSAGRDGASVFRFDRQAVNALNEVASDLSSPLDRDWVGRLTGWITESARLLAVTTIGDANRTSMVDADLLAQAEQALAVGDQHDAAGDQATAINSYRDAWRYANQAHAE